MARTLKNFNTEEEYEEWVNSPYMRTPYTCLVKETGNVHYFDGDDDDYSITLIYKFDDNDTHLVRFIGANLAPRIQPDTNMEYQHKVGFHETKHGRVNEKIKTGVTVYKNGEALDGNDLFGTFTDGHNDSKHSIYKTRRNGYDHFIDNKKTRGDRGNIRKFMYVKNGDIIKIVFSNLDKLPQGGFYNISYVDEIIIGDGIKKVGNLCFKRIGAKKIYIGKNVEELGINCFCQNGYITGNLCNKKLKEREKNFYTYNRMPKYSEGLIEMIRKNNSQ